MYTVNVDNRMLSLLWPGAAVGFASCMGVMGSLGEGK